MVDPSFSPYANSIDSTALVTLGEGNCATSTKIQHTGMMRKEITFAHMTVQENAGFSGISCTTIT